MWRTAPTSPACACLAMEAAAVKDVSPLGPTMATLNPPHAAPAAVSAAEPAAQETEMWGNQELGVSWAPSP